ncbi:MAG: hydrogenase maturation protease [Nitrospirota bacterium]
MSTNVGLGWGMGGEGWGDGWPPAVARGLLGGPEGQPSPHPPSPNPHPPLVIGIGNGLRGDDAAGPMVAALLNRRLGGEVALVSGGDVAELIALWEGREAVVVVDAMTSGRPPGTVVRYDGVLGSLPVQMFARSTHAFGLAEAVELSRALGALPARLVIYGIELASTTVGSDPSPAVVAAVQVVVEAIAAEVATHALAQ